MKHVHTNVDPTSPSFMIRRYSLEWSKSHPNFNPTAEHDYSRVWRECVNRENGPFFFRNSAIAKLLENILDVRNYPDKDRWRVVDNWFGGVVFYYDRGLPSPNSAPLANFEGTE